MSNRCAGIVVGTPSMLRDMNHKYDDLKSQVVETDVAWDDRFLDSLTVGDLVTLPVDQLAERILARRANPVGASSS